MHCIVEPARLRLAATIRTAAAAPIGRRPPGAARMPIARPRRLPVARPDLSPAPRSVRRPR
ncbi:hypothetical protein F5D26_17995 [Burkholderia pseudomallei]|nr:hypothetical protein F5D26_17995 [Burkholderia pseudomallei]